MKTESRFRVGGLKCAGCVSKASTALQAVPGVTGTEVDLASRTAVVRGEVEPAAVIDALQAVGYTAELISDQSPSQ